MSNFAIKKKCSELIKNFKTSVFKPAFLYAIKKLTTFFFSNKNPLFQIFIFFINYIIGKVIITLSGQGSKFRVRNHSVPPYRPSGFHSVLSGCAHAETPPWDCEEGKCLKRQKVKSKSFDIEFSKLSIQLEKY